MLFATKDRKHRKDRVFWAVRRQNIEIYNSNLSRRPCVALRASPPSSTTVTVTTACIWACFFHVFYLRFCCGDAFGTDTLLQVRTEAFTQSSFYAQILLHREVCAQRSFYRSFYTPILCTKMLLRAWIKARRRFYTHRTFSQRSLCTEQLLHKALTQRNLYTQTAQRSFYTPKLLHAETLAAFTHFPHRSFYAQKFLRKAVFTHRCF